MPIVQGTWRRSHFTKSAFLENRTLADKGVRAQKKAEALMALKAVLPAGEYEAMVSQCQRGEREVFLENGFILTCFSPERGDSKSSGG
jgi:hypothetical protein